MWSENGHVVGSLHILLAGKKRGRIWFHIICLKLYQFERTTWWCLFNLERVMEHALKYVLLNKILKKSRLPKFAANPPLGGGHDEDFGRPWQLIHSPPCRNPCRVFIHEVFFGPIGLHLWVWSELDGLRPFDQRELLDCNGHGSSIFYVKWPLQTRHVGKSCINWVHYGHTNVLYLLFTSGHDDVAINYVVII